MEWDKLKVFYHLAKSGSISQAAQTLNTSQPALSRTLQLLEHRLNSKLFHRQPRGITLTKQGQILFRQVQIMMIAAEEAIALLEEEQNTPKGLLKVGVTAGFASLYLSPYIPDFLRKYPDIRLDIIANDILPNIEDREVDVIIGPPHADHPDLIEHPLARFQLKLYASSEYLEKFGTPKSVEELDHHRLIGVGDHRASPFMPLNWHLTAGKQKGEVREAYIQINLAQSRCLFAEKDLGIIAIPCETPFLKESGLVEVLPHVEGPIIDMYYGYLTSQKNSKKIKVFHDYLNEVFISYRRLECEQLKQKL